MITQCVKADLIIKVAQPNTQKIWDMFCVRVQPTGSAIDLCYGSGD